MAESTALGSLTKILREEITFVKREVEPEIDAMFSKLYRTSKGVSKGIGRDFKVIHTFPTGVAGSFHNLAAEGQPTLDQAFVTGTGQTSQWNTTLNRTFPGLSSTTSPGYAQRTITLVQGMGNFHLPFQFFQADKIDGATTDSVAHIVKGTMKNVAQIEANNFYSNNATTNAIVTVKSTAGLTNNGSANVTFTIDDGTNIEGRIGRLLPGMSVAGGDSSASDDVVLANSQDGVITQVDYVGKVFIVHFSGGNVTFDTDDYLVPAGSIYSGEGTIGLSGMEPWLTDTGTIFGLNLTNHPQFKSLVGAVNAVLDEATLNKFVGGFFDAYGGMYSLDSVITTTGVMTAYMEAIDGLYRYGRNGERLVLKEGWSSMDYAWQGKVFEIMASRYQKPGQAYICKTADGNIKRYVPPNVDGTGKEAGFVNEIQFVAQWMGSSSMFLPAPDTSANLTEFVQSPFIATRECAPDQLPGIKLTGLSELNP